MPDIDLPYELTYGIQNTEVLSIEDEANLQYQNLYKSYEYFAKKFTLDTSNIPGFDAIIQEMADNSKTPLEEYNERFCRDIIVSDNYEIELQPGTSSIVSEFKEC